MAQTVEPRQETAEDTVPGGSQRPTGAAKSQLTNNKPNGDKLLGQDIRRFVSKPQSPRRQTDSILNGQRQFDRRVWLWPVTRERILAVANRPKQKLLQCSSIGHAYVEIIDEQRTALLHNGVTASRRPDGVVNHSWSFDFRCSTSSRILAELYFGFLAFPRVAFGELQTPL